jgi:hypothetical protein
MAAWVAHCLLVRAEQKKLTMSDATIIREAVQPLTGSALGKTTQLLSKIGREETWIIGISVSGAPTYVNTFSRESR